MATWYVDYLNGTDSNASAGNGDSFATRRKTLSNIVANALAPGDFIRVMKSPDATSLGITGTWTGARMSSALVPTSSTNATPIVVTKVGHGLVTGDTVVITNHTTNTNANGTWKVTVSGDTFTLLNADGTNSVGNGAGGATGTFRKITNRVVILASALTKTIALVGNRGTKTNWTASANVTNTIHTTDWKEGGEGQQIAIAAGFTTGLAAYYPLGASTDFSAYKQISFLIKQTVGTVGAAGACTISLCSDTAGATPVNTINIPSLVALDQWRPITVDVGSALGATIQSVAFNVVTDNGAQSFLIDNIIACKDSTLADSLSLTSLISKNTGSEGWYGIQSINDVRVTLDMENNCFPASITNRGYSATTETVTTYKLDTLKTTPVASTSTIVQSILDSGSAGNLITISGGWNTTDMSTKTGFTFFDGVNGYGYGIVAASMSYLDISTINFCRYSLGLLFQTECNNNTVSLSYINNMSGSGCSITGNTNTITITNINNNGGTYGFAPIGHYNTVTITNANNNNLYGVYATSLHNSSITITNANNNDYGLNITNSGTNNFTVTNANNNTTIGVYLSASWDNIGVITSSTANSYGLYFNNSGNNKFKITSSSGNIYSAVSLNSSDNYLTESVLNDLAKIVFTNYQNNFIWSHHEDGNANTNYGYTDGGLIASDVTTRHTASGLSWKMTPTSSIRDATYPLSMPVGKVACNLNQLVTASLWMRRTNTGLTAKLVCKGGQIAGVVADVSTAMTAAADTWEQVTITFTPTEVGVVEITAQCYGGTTYSAYVDDFTVI